MINERYVQSCYRDWMYKKVIEEEPDAPGYRSLLDFLYSVPFTYSNLFDENRYADAIALRYRYGIEETVPEIEITKCLSREVSVLEMMVALAIRMEEHIMHSDDLGDRTPKWFLVMIDSLGLRDMDDCNFNEGYAAQIIETFLDREYAPDGQGGLFYIPGIKEDLREEEIWYQMCKYLITVIEEEEY